VKVVLLMALSKGNMSNINYIALIVDLWGMYLRFIFLFKKWIKEKKNTWKLEPKVGQEAISDVNYERAKKDKLERDLEVWKRFK